MSEQITSTNPVVQAIILGTAPPQARSAAARGLLPLPQSDLLEVLVALGASDDPELARMAAETLASQDAESLLPIAKESATAPAVLRYMSRRQDLGPEIREALALNPLTPDDAIMLLAHTTADSSLLDLIAVNQQRLIRLPALIDALLNNPARATETERRLRETKREFFEKERGAQQVAGELRAQGRFAAAEFLEAAESVAADEFDAADAWLIADHIEVSDADIDDSWLDLALIEEIFEETPEQRRANVERVLRDTALEHGVLPQERISLIRRVMLMTVKDRIKLGMKGDREARGILVRDSNRIVATAVIHNPRITEQEIEGIAAMRTVNEEVLRLIAMNRKWARSYSITVNLARNPRTPIATAMTQLTRIRTKDLQAIAQNRNVSEAVRRQAQRLASTREGK
jgi:hypothetical protein